MKGSNCNEYKVSDEKLKGLLCELDSFYERSKSDDNTVKNFIDIFLYFDTILLDLNEKTKDKPDLKFFVLFITDSFFKNIDFIKLFQNNNDIQLSENIKNELNIDVKSKWDNEKLKVNKISLILHFLSGWKIKSNTLNSLKEISVIFQYIYDNLEGNNISIEDIWMQLYRIFLKLWNVLSPSLENEKIYYEEYIFDKNNYIDNPNDIFNNLVTFQVKILKERFNVDKDILDRYTNMYYNSVGKFYSKELTNKELFTELFNLLNNILKGLKIVLSCNIEEYKSKIHYLTNKEK